MPISVTWKDTTRFEEFRESRVGRKILARALSKTAISGKTEGKKGILQIYTIKPGKVELYTKPARPDRLEAEIGARSTDARGKKAIPLHEFSFRWKRPRRKKIVAGFPAPLTGEVIRGQVTKWKGGFSALGRSSGKTVAIRRQGEERLPTTTLTGPSVGAMFTNPRVVEPLLRRIAERLPVVLDQEANFAMNYETDKGQEAVTDESS